MQYYLITYSLNYDSDRHNMILHMRPVANSRMFGILWIHSVTPIFI